MALRVSPLNDRHDDEDREQRQVGEAARPEIAAAATSRQGSARTPRGNQRPHRPHHDDDNGEAGAEPADEAMHVDAPRGDEQRLQHQQQDPCGEGHAVDVEEERLWRRKVLNLRKPGLQEVGAGKSEEHRRQHQERHAGVETPFPGQPVTRANERVRQCPPSGCRNGARRADGYLPPAATFAKSPALMIEIFAGSRCLRMAARTSAGVSFWMRCSSSRSQSSVRSWNRY